MTFSSEEPSIDFDNPMYCPNTSAHQYMASIRLFQAAVTDGKAYPYFHRMSLAFSESKFEDSPQSLPIQLMPTLLLSQNNSVKIENDTDLNNTDLEPVPTTNSELKRGADFLSETSECLLEKPAKRIKRSSSYMDNFFILSAKADRLRFSDKIEYQPNSDIVNDSLEGSPAQEVFWPEKDQNDATFLSFVESTYESRCKETKNVEEDTGPETPKSIAILLKRLDMLLPGMRLAKFFDPSMARHQDILDNLSMKGHLNPQILLLFRKAQINGLNLSESMAEADGLNLLSHDILKVLKDPSSFQSLRRLTLSNVPLSDDDLSNLSNLRCLDFLFLDSTDIGDIAVMHLIALRGTLTHLNLSWNERITDDAIPTLCALTNLCFISLKQTNVTMKGLYKLTTTVKDREKRISIVLPSECEEYISDRHYEYEIQLDFPLIHDPQACHKLSSSALKDNLAAHAARNPDIATGGTREEQEKRLRKLLERRQKDMVVHGFMLQGFV